MSYEPKKAVPLAIATLDEVIKMVIRKDKLVNDEALEEIFLTLFRDTSLKKEAIDEMLFKLHASCHSAIALLKNENFKEIKVEKEMSKELTYKEASDELGCSISHIKKLVKEGKLIPKHYSLRTVRIVYSEIIKYRETYGV
jgi:DNA-directed RNA polymerase specialized sigma24 family protein